MSDPDLITMLFHVLGESGGQLTLDDRPLSPAQLRGHLGELARAKITYPVHQATDYDLRNVATEKARFLAAMEGEE